MGGMSADHTTGEEVAHDEADGKSTKLDWTEVIRKGTSLHEVDLVSGRNGWGEPPASLFPVRGENFFSKKAKTASASEPFLKSLGVDWLRSSSGKLEHVLAHPSNIVKRTLEHSHSQAEGLKAFVLAINLMIPGKEYHSAVLYFATEEPIRQGSLLHRFVNGDDAFRNDRLKLINKIVRGPWIVRAAAGNHSACLLGKALTCHYHRGPSYLEIDVDIGSSAVANAILHLALGYVTSVAVDMAFVIESRTPEELPERILGVVRVAHMEIGEATVLDVVPEGEKSPAGSGLQSQGSWRRLGRGLSMLAGMGKHGKVESEAG